MVEISCSCCELLLGEAEQAVEIVCPLCRELRLYIEYFVMPNGELSQTQWENAVFAKVRETDDMIDGMLKKRSLIGALE